MPSKSFYQTQSGVALLITILLMSLILFLSIYVLSFSLTEDRIARSQTWGEKTYYLAEAGMQEMVWKLKNDAAYKQNFETNPSWTAEFTRDNPFGAASGSYTVTLTNSSLAHGQITSTAAIDIGADKTSRRVVKVYVYKALGQSDLKDNCGYADGNIDISASAVDFHNGSAHSNNNFTINNASLVNIDQDLNAVNQYIESLSSTVNVGGTVHAANYLPAATPIDMPAIDFDSADPNSYKNKATIVYTQTQFKNLMKANQNLTLAGPITYVDGDVELRGGQHLTINGVLVIGRDLIVGHYLTWTGGRFGLSSITVNYTPDQPAGIFAKRKINFKLWTGDIDITGLIYANDQLNILSLPLGGNGFTVVGGLVGRKLTVTSTWNTIDITFDNGVITDALGATQFSPVITVEHWEEEY